MRTHLIFITTLIVLCGAVSVQAGPLRAFGTAPEVSSNSPEGSGRLLSPGASVSGAALSRPPASYRPHSGPSDPPADESDLPRYPYPPNPNPYYEGASNRNVLSEGIEWLWGASTTVADRVSNFVDTRFFPIKPATHGGGVSQSPASGPVRTQGAGVSVGPVPAPGTGVDAGGLPVTPNTGLGVP